MSFVKLDCGILDSSLWIERDARSVFVTTLLMATPYVLEDDTPAISVRTLEPSGFVVPAGRYGFAKASGSGIIRRDGIEMEKGWLALEALCAPDPESRSEEYDGRRLARVNGGYIVLNFKKYRDFDHTAAERSRRYRERQKADEAGPVTRDDSDDGVTGSDASASASPSPSESVPVKAKSNKDSLQGERPGVKKLDEFLARWPFGRFADLVTGYLRASRSSIAVIQTFEMHLTGEMSHEKATPDQLGLALQQYMPQELDGQFKAMFFAGCLRKVKAMPERAARRSDNAAEDRRLIEEKREAEQREQDQRDTDMLNDFERRNEDRFTELKAKAEASVDKRIKGHTRVEMARGSLIALVRAERR